MFGLQAVCRLSAFVPVYFRTSLIRNNSVARKMVFPLIKALHPDLYAQESQVVQTTNIQCIQSLNSLWDCIDALIDDMIEARKQQRTTIDVKMIFLPEYSLSCYSRQKEHAKIEVDGSDEVSTKLTEHKFNLISPEPLKKKQTLQIEEVKNELNKVFIQHGDLFRKLALKDPWESLRAKSSSHEDDDYENLTADEAEKKANAELNLLAYERINRISMYSGGKGYHNLFMDNEYRGTNKGGRIHYSGEDLIRQKMRMDRREKDVDTYIRSGKIMLQNLTEEEEVPAVRKIRNFLIDYYLVLQFSPYVWGPVVIVIEPPKPVNTTGVVLKAAPSKSTEITLNKYSKYGFSCMIEGEGRNKHYLIRTPMNFKEKRLLHFLQENLPMTNIILDMKFSEKKFGVENLDNI